MLCPSDERHEPPTRQLDPLGGASRPAVPAASHPGHCLRPTAELSGLGRLSRARFAARHAGHARGTHLGAASETVRGARRAARLFARPGPERALRRASAWALRRPPRLWTGTRVDRSPAARGPGAAGAGAADAHAGPAGRPGPHASLRGEDTHGPLGARPQRRPGVPGGGARRGLRPLRRHPAARTRDAVVRREPGAAAPGAAPQSCGRVGPPAARDAASSRGRRRRRPRAGRQHAGDPDREVPAFSGRAYDGAPREAAPDRLGQPARLSRRRRHPACTPRDPARLPELTAVGRDRRPRRGARPRSRPRSLVRSELCAHQRAAGCTGRPTRSRGPRGAGGCLSRSALAAARDPAPERLPARTARSAKRACRPPPAPPRAGGRDPGRAARRGWSVHSACPTTMRSTVSTSARRAHSTATFSSRSSGDSRHCESRPWWRQRGCARRACSRTPTRTV
jgi:hypothetical protein